MDKKEIISNIIEEHQKTIENLENSINKYTQASDLDEDNTLDPEDYSHQNEAEEIKHRFEQMVIQEKKNKEILSDFTTKSCQSIEPGAFVDLGELYLFMGISIHPFTINDINVHTISEDAPIYSLLKGKTIGDEIVLGSSTYSIKNIQ